MCTESLGYILPQVDNQPLNLMRCEQKKWASVGIRVTLTGGANYDGWMAESVHLQNGRLVVRSQSAEMPKGAIVWLSLGSTIHVGVTLTPIIYLNTAADQVLPFMKHCPLMAVASSSRTKRPATPWYWFEDVLRNPDLWEALEPTSPIHGGPIPELTGFRGCLRLGARYHSTPSEVLWSPCLHGSEVFWWPKGDQHR